MSDGFRFGAVSTRAIRDPNVSPHALRVLNEIATFADADGWCTVRQEVMSDHLGVSRQAISKHVQTLAELGHLLTKVNYGPDGSQRANSYCVRLDPATPEVAPPQPSLLVPPATPEVAAGRTDLVNRPSRESRPRKSPSTSVPEEWTLTDERLEWVRAECPGLDPYAATQEWLTACDAKDLRYVRWEPAWRNAMRRSMRWRIQEGPGRTHL